MILTIMALLLLIVIFLIQWAKRVPEARAWDPNSHDKMVCYALDMMAKMKPTSLLGWVIQQSRINEDGGPVPLASIYRRNVELQMRRGSIDEDMNSHMVYKCETTMGANGGYHYWNPYTGDGLSEAPAIVLFVGKNIEHCPNPMPSAYMRATQVTEGPDPGYISTGPVGPLVKRRDNAGWHLDHEGRNYTVADADKYYQWGHAHLAFYSIGRTAHLLEDMAVPAHTRNDAHSGVGDDPVDPLEDYADQNDGAPGQYYFSKDRAYQSQGNEIFNRAQNEWLGLRGANRRKTIELFEPLAKWSHDNFYTYNTIPGNTDSHRPDKPDKPLWRNGTPIDWTKCTIGKEHAAKGVGRSAEVEPIWDFLGSLVAKAEKIIANLPSLDRRGDDFYRVEDQIRRIREACQGPDCESIDKLNRVLAGLQYIYPFIEVCGNREDVCGGVARDFLWRYIRAHIPSFAKAALHSMDVHKAKKQWLEEHTNDTLEGELAEAFAGRHGPLVLSDQILHEQWLTTQPKATAYVAILLSNWFENLYSPGTGRGIGVWLNRDKEGTPDSVLDVATIVQSGTRLVTEHRASIGIINHLPIAISLTVEIELIREGTDEEAWNSGVEIEVTCNHVEANSAMSGGAAQGLPEQKDWLGRETLSGTSAHHEFVISSAEPYCLGLYRRCPVPMAGTEGGIKREAESELPRVGLFPEQNPGSLQNDLLTALLLRIEPRVSESAAGASKGLNNG
jgi:hypothetical protein